MEIEEFESKLKNKTFTEEELQELVQDYWISPDKEEKETQPNVFILKNGLFNIRTTKNTKIAILDGQWECIERID